MSIDFRVAKPEEKDKILCFLRESYYPEEPLTIGTEPKQQTYEDEEFSLSNLSYGTCILAIQKLSSSLEQQHKEDIIGLAIAGPKTSNEADHIMEIVQQSKTQKWIELLKLFAILERNANVFQRYNNITKAVHLHVLSVNKNSRGKSIGVKLMKKCMENCKMLGYQLLTVDCTSVYSIRIAEKLNMDCVGILRYKDYVDENKRQIFNPPQPHEYIKTFAKLL